MSLSRWCVVLGLAALLSDAPAALAQQGNLHIGYVYPAGGKQGTTFEIVVGGQFLTGVNNVLVSGSGVQSTITEHIRPMTGKERTDLRLQMDELLARKAVVTKDFRALEAFRSFKNAKTVKTDTAAKDQEIERLKKKYAGASWTAADDGARESAEENRHRQPKARQSGNLGTRRRSNDLGCKRGAGRRELRIASPNGLSNPLVFSSASWRSIPKTHRRPSPNRKALSPRRRLPSKLQARRKCTSRCRPSSTARSCPARWTVSASRRTRGSGWWSLPPRGS